MNEEDADVLFPVQIILFRMKLLSKTNPPKPMNTCHSYFCAQQFNLFVWQKIIGLFFLFRCTAKSQSNLLP